jgi:hypothetical protein
MSYQLSSDARIIPLPSVDIGGSDAETVDATNWAPFFDISGFDRVTAVVRLGPTWNAADDLDTCKLEQATSAAGAGAKDLTTSSATGDYDTDTPVDAVGDEVILEARADQCDVDNGFHFVRVFVAETGNTGTDEVHASIILHGARYGHAERHRAAAAGSVVYVTPTVA